MCSENKCPQALQIISSTHVLGNERNIMSEHISGSFRISYNILGRRLGVFVPAAPDCNVDCLPRRVRPLIVKTRS